MSQQRPRPAVPELDALIPLWGLPTSNARAFKRSESTMEQITAFYDAMMPRVEEIIDYLDQFPLEEIPEADLPLARATLAVCEVDFAVNKWHVANVATGIDIHDMPEKTGPYDRPLSVSR